VNNTVQEQQCRKGQVSGRVNLPLIKLVSLLSGILLFTVCQEDKSLNSNYTLPNQVIRDFELNEAASGRRLYSLTARVAVVREDESRIDVETLKVIFYDDADRPYSWLVADIGTVWMKTEDLVSRGNVRVETGDSTVLKTDSLAWSNSRRIIHTGAEVIIESPKGVIVGTGLVADAQLNKIEIMSEVRGSGSYEFQP
jgi:LPS export ABC transporter protein LptC